ncbi:MAG: GFA family protein [Bradyrhizobium sp.]
MLNQGGCLCGSVRYTTASKPIRVTFCHCRFCQQATGSAYMVEPIFEKTNFEVTSGTPTTYSVASRGSGKLVTINFCAVCGTKLFLAFERFPDLVGIYGGTFDDPNWFERTPQLSQHIFLDSAQQGTIIPPGVRAYRQHMMRNDGTRVEPITFQRPHAIPKLKSATAAG